jgi:hypothetical protein
MPGKPCRSLLGSERMDSRPSTRRRQPAGQIDWQPLFADCRRNSGGTSIWFMNEVKTKRTVIALYAPPKPLCGLVIESSGGPLRRLDQSGLSEAIGGIGEVLHRVRLGKNQLRGKIWSQSFILLRFSFPFWRLL